MVSEGCLCTAALGLERSWDPLELMSQLVVSLREDIKYPRTDAADGCEPPLGCWELNSGPLQEQQALNQ